MVLNTFITGVETKLSQILRASDCPDVLTAITRIDREMQLNYFESHKLHKPNQTPSQLRKPEKIMDSHKMNAKKDSIMKQSSKAFPTVTELKNIFS